MSQPEVQTVLPLFVSIKLKIHVRKMKVHTKLHNFGYTKFKLG